MVLAQRMKLAWMAVEQQTMAEEQQMMAVERRTMAVERRMMAEELLRTCRLST